MALLADTSWTTYSFALGLALLAGILVRRSRAYFSARGRNRREAAAAVLSHPTRQFAASSAAPPSVQRWEVEMHEMTRELTARIDSKMILLQSLIAEAERAALRLEQALEQDSESRPASRNLQRNSEVAAVAADVPRDTFHAAYQIPSGPTANT